jgi:hypothetical protein
MTSRIPSSRNVSRYASNSNIFDQEEVLREDHHPDKLPERCEELDQLHMALSPAARGVGANNVFLYGKAGQGKTAAVKHELSELRYHADQESDHLELTALYISCESHDISTDGGRPPNRLLNRCCCRYDVRRDERDRWDDYYRPR